MSPSSSPLQQKQNEHGSGPILVVGSQTATSTILMRRQEKKKTTVSPPSSYYNHYWIVLLFLGLLVMSCRCETSSSESSSNSTVQDDHEEDEEEDETPPVYAVLLPWVAQALGIVVFYILTRYIHAIPYTGILFVLGTCMGAGASLSQETDQLTESINLWIQINHRVLFCTFLPGLLFKDALEINFHLFVASFWQIMYLAFPMVLGGTFLTAVVGMYVFPYGWSLYMALTFGSILAATDPVAVCVLLNEVSAPPRLRTHIGGEALWNDGSAVVFYSVFSQLFLYELNVPGLGQEVTVADAFAIFFRMSLGGVAVGLAYAMVLIGILYTLNRRLEAEEKVLQVASTVTVAYLSFYTADVICTTSGVIAVVVLGTLTKAFGGSFINDWQIMDSFWSLLEHLLNTLLFTLGGIEFGQVVSSSRDGHEWNASDWGYLFALYLLINIIRFLCLFASYPLLARIGLGTNWQETVFSGWAGLRGAVAITLALGLNNEVNEATDDPSKTVLTSKMFGMVGGVAFLTLIINASFSGPLLVKLGLVDDTDARKRILKSAEASARRRILDDFLKLMTDPRFAFVDFALVKNHVPLLDNLTADELEQAVQENKNSVHPSVYRQPNLHHVFPYVPDSSRLRLSMERMERDSFFDKHTFSTSLEAELSDSVHNGNNGMTEDGKMTDGEEEEKPNPDLVKDVRIMFVELLRSAYHSQIRDGEINAREYNGFLAYILLQSLDFAHDSASAGEPLNDWEARASPVLVEKVEDYGRRVYKCFCFKKEENEDPCITTVDDHETNHSLDRLRLLRDEQPLQYQLVCLDVLRAFAFIDAHQEAQDRLQVEFGKETGELFGAFCVVLKESKAQMSQARQLLRATSMKQLKHIISHHLCMILQNKAARYYQLLHDSGILMPRESRRYLQEIEHQISAIHSCRLDEHPGWIEYVEETPLDGPQFGGNQQRHRRVKQKSLL